MNDCHTVLDLLPAQLLGDAGEFAQQAIDEHLSSCSGCRAEGERLRSLLSTLNEADVPDPGDLYWQTFLPRLRSRIRQSHRNETRSRTLSLRMASALAASLLIFVLAAWMLGRWTAPSGWNPGAQLDLLVEESNPGEFEGVVDEMLFGTANDLAAGDAGDLLVPLDEMQWALESLLPPREEGGYSRAEELSPAVRNWLVQNFETGHV